MCGRSVEYIDQTQHDDIDWTPYNTHQEIVSFDPISFYSGWLACRMNLMCRYLPERCMRQFGYVHIIMISPFVYAPNIIVCRHLDNILTNYESHLIPDEYLSMSATSQWSYIDDYMT